MLVTLLGMVTEVKRLQSSKAPSPMLVTLLGIVTEVKLLQYAKVLLPMLVTLLGMVIEVKPLQPEKAPSAIDSMPSGIIYAPEYDSGIYANTCALYTGEVRLLHR